MRKRLLAIIATAAMVVAMVPSMVFAAPVDAAGLSGQTITSDVELSGDVTVTDRITIDGNVTLDLKGKELKSTANSGFGAIYVKYGAELTIIDSVGGGRILAENDYAIGNYGTVNIEAGTITGYYALYNFSYSGYTNASVANVSGGTLSSNSSENVAVANCGILNLSGTAKIEDTLDSSAKLNMTGGIVENLLVKEDTSYTPACGYEPSVSGGEVTGDVTVLKADGSADTDKKFITGGTFATDVSTYLEEGYEQVNGKVYEEGTAPAPTPDPTPGETPDEPSTEDQATTPAVDTEEPAEESEDAADTGDNMNMAIPFAIAGLALVAMAAVVVTRRRTN